MDEKKFIEEVLKDRIEEKISSSKEIIELNDKILLKIYSNYMNYPNNKDNLIKSRERLKEYYFSNNNLSKGEYITYINPKFFYDLRIHKGGFITEINKNIIKLVNGNNFWIINSNKINIFTKLTKEQKIKLIIIDSFEK
tara:strand:+ start:125 stop:541 length:417 start_codon:yes stop_codon:yes gene_type:complete